MQRIPLLTVSTLLLILLAAPLRSHSGMVAAQNKADVPANAATKPADPASPAALIGKPAPAFTLEDMQGKQVSLSDYRGKAVLINFWATWCGPCRIEMPWLIELRQQYAAKGFEVLGLSADDIDRKDPAHFASEKKGIARSVAQLQIPYPVLIDAAALGDAYGGLDSLPVSLFVDRNGNVVAVQSGLTSKNEIEANVLCSLGEKVPEALLE